MPSTTRTDLTLTALRVPNEVHEQVRAVAERCGRSANTVYIELARLSLTGQCQADVSQALEELFPVV